MSSLFRVRLIDADWNGLGTKSPGRLDGWSAWLGSGCPIWAFFASLFLAALAVKNVGYYYPHVIPKLSQLDSRARLLPSHDFGCLVPHRCPIS